MSEHVIARSGEGVDQPRASERPLSEAYDAALLDLDGVVYLGGAAVPKAPSAMAEVPASRRENLCNRARTSALLRTERRPIGSFLPMRGLDGENPLIQSSPGG